MASVTPNIVGLIFARQIEINLAAAEFSLDGLFNDRSFPHFPTDPVEMLVFASLIGGRGEGIIQTSVHRLDDMEEYDLSSGWIYRQQKWMKFSDDPNRIVTLEIRIRRLVFLEPGHYLFVLTFDGNPIAERRMSVIAEEANGD